MGEVKRQLVHIAGVAFVIAAQFIGSSISALFFLIAAMLVFWSWYIKHAEHRTRNLLTRLEHGFRETILHLERKYSNVQFSGAIWYFIGCGVTFLIFPLNIASAACVILSIGDGMATIAGKLIGKKKTIGEKTFEGSFVFFFSALFASLFFVPSFVAIIGSLSGTIVEMLFGTKIFQHANQHGFLDDNIAIPIITAVLMYVAFFYMV